MLTFVSRVKSSKEMAKGSSGGEKVPWLTIMVLDDGPCGSQRCRLTIVYHDTRNTERLLHSIKGIDHILRLREVARDVQLAVGAVGFLHRAGCDSNLVTFRGKFANDGLANVGPCANDEGDGRFCCHCVMLSCVEFGSVVLVGLSVNCLSRVVWCLAFLLKLECRAYISDSIIGVSRDFTTLVTSVIRSVCQLESFVSD